MVFYSCINKLLEQLERGFNHLPDVGLRDVNDAR
jgi:hypothetical protein